MKKIALIFLVIFFLILAGCVNNVVLSGSYINIQTNQTCLDISSDGTYLIRSVGSSLSIQEKYEIKNNKLLLTLPMNLLFGQIGQNNIVVTCDINGNTINCGKEGGIYQKIDSCSSTNQERITPTPMANSYQCLANTSLTQSQLDKDHMKFTLNYQDTCGLTSDVIFYVKARNNIKPIYSKDLGNPGTSLVTASYTVKGVMGQEYIGSYNAKRDV